MNAASSVKAARKEREGTMLDMVLANAAALREGLAPLGATSVSVFGSVARRAERSDSDVDILVDLEPDVGLFALLRMQGLAEKILGRPVDLMSRADLKDNVARNILEDEIRL